MFRFNRGRVNQPADYTDLLLTIFLPSLSPFISVVCRFFKKPFPKNSFKSFVERFVGKVKILRAVDFHAIGGANGPYFCRMEDVVFDVASPLINPAL